MANALEIEPAQELPNPAEAPTEETVDPNHLYQEELRKRLEDVDAFNTRQEIMKALYKERFGNAR